jgi:hypothetical protein
MKNNFSKEIYTTNLTNIFFTRSHVFTRGSTGAVFFEYRHISTEIRIPKSSSIVERGSL